MAEQKFPDTLKDCIWKSHRERCFYCEKPVKFIDFEIDHLIPEYLVKKPEELSAVKIKYALDESFDILGKENFAPSCGSCNRKKADSLLPVGQVAILLNTISSKLSKIEDCINKKKGERKLGSLLLGLSKGIENKLFSNIELLQGLEKTGLITLESSRMTFPPSEIEYLMRKTFGVETRNIKFSPHSVLSVDQRNMSFDDVLSIFQKGVSVKEITMSKPTDQFIYTVQNDEIKVRFEIRDDEIYIITCL